MKLTGPGKDRRRLLSIRWKGARVGGERRKVRAAEMKAAIRGVHGIPGTVRAGVHLHAKPEVEHSREDEGGVSRGKGMGESPKGRGVPGDVDLARGPAVGGAGT